MQKAITLNHQGKTLRGMEHIPDFAKGSVPVVILFHGFTGTKLEPHRLFLKISRALEQEGIASFRFDFLGSGESDGNFEEMTASTEIAEANTILNFVKKDSRIDSSQVTLLGLSMGGLVASVLAGDRPEDIHKLILLAPAGNMYEIIKDAAEAYLAHPGLKVVDYYGNLVGREFAEDLRTLDVFERARHYEGEVLLVHGTKDPTVPCEVSSMYQEQSYEGRAKIHFIAEADHTFNRYEWETELISEICSFI
jgi:uncharacterized protein